VPLPRPIHVVALRRVETLSPNPRHSAPPSVNTTARWLICLGLLCLLGHPHRNAHTAPLAVQSATTLQASVLPGGQWPTIQGRLMDNVNQGLQARIDLLVFVEPPTQPLPRPGSAALPPTPGAAPAASFSLNTDRLGYFEQEVFLPEGDYRASINFHGHGDHRATQRQLRFQVRRISFQPQINFPRNVLANTNTTIPIEVRAKLNTPTDKDLAFTLRIGQWPQLTETISLADNPLAFTSNLLGQNLRADRIEIPAQRLASGPNPFALESNHPDIFIPVALHGEAFIFRNPKLKLYAEYNLDREQRGLRVFGEADTEAGPPTQALLRVQVTNQRRPWQEVGTARVQDDGYFETLIPRDRLPPGDILLRVLLSPDHGEPFASPSIELEIPVPSATGWGYLLILTLATLSALALVAWLTKHAVHILRQRRRRRPAPLPDAPSRLSPDLSAGPPPPMSTDLDGRVIDFIDQTPVVSATIDIFLAGKIVASTTADARGRFRLRALPRGRLSLNISANGYVSASAPILVPLPAQKRQIRVELCSVREQIRRVFNWFLTVYAPHTQLWGQRTPREIEAELRRHLDTWVQHLGPNQPLHPDLLGQLLAGPIDAPELTSLFRQILEEVYYSHRTYQENMAHHAQDIASRLQPRLANRHVPSDHAQPC